jgi:hypothetical protein
LVTPQFVEIDSLSLPHPSDSSSLIRRRERSRLSAIQQLLKIALGLL